MALDFDFSIKDIEVLALDNDGVNLGLLISVTNKSSFAIEVIDYDIDMIYEGTNVAKAKSSQKFIDYTPSEFTDNTDLHGCKVGFINVLDFHNKSDKTKADFAKAIFEKLDN